MDVILILETSVELGALHHDSQLVLREVVMRGFLHFGVRLSINNNSRSASKRF
jgi:hypothetical protein